MVNKVMFMVTSYIVNVLQISKVILESEFDVKLDPQLFDACKGTIEKHCTQVSPIF